MTGGTLRPSSVSDTRRVHRCCAVRPMTHHSPMDLVLRYEFNNVQGYTSTNVIYCIICASMSHAAIDYP